MNFIKDAIIPFTLILLVSCGLTSESPREGGLGGGIIGISTGSYEKRIQDLKEKLSKMQTALEEKKRKEAYYYQQISEKEKDILSLESELETLKNESKNLKINIENSTTEKHVLLEENKKLLNRIKNREQAVNKERKEKEKYNRSITKLRNEKIDLERDIKIHEKEIDLLE